MKAMAVTCSSNLPEDGSEVGMDGSSKIFPVLPSGWESLGNGAAARAGPT